MKNLVDHIYILATIFFTVTSQLIMRWQVSSLEPLPESFSEKLSFISHLFLNPWIILSILATFLAGLSWMLAMTKFEISYAYPWIAFNFLLMMFFGWLFFSELITLTKLAGTLLVVVGIVVLARG
jgi:multidrug transporter EmrE-like cation transporter